MCQNYLWKAEHTLESMPPYIPHTNERVGLLSPPRYNPRQLPRQYTTSFGRVVYLDFCLQNITNYLDTFQNAYKSPPLSRHCSVLSRDVCFNNLTAEAFRNTSPALIIPPKSPPSPPSFNSTADRLLGQGMGNYEEPLSPGGSPRFSSRRRPDSRRAILLYMTFANLFLALVLLILGGAGPGYPGHSGTVDNSYFSGTGVSAWDLRLGRGDWATSGFRTVSCF